MEHRLGTTRVLVMAFTVAAAATAIAQVTPAKLDVVRVSVGGENMFLKAGQANGFFAKHGIEVQEPTLPPGGSDSVRASLANGTLDVVHSIVDNAVALVELGGSDVVIVMGGAGSLYELIAQPEIRSVKDLRGKRVIVDAPYTALALHLKKILLSNGLKAGVDYEMVGGATGNQRMVELRKKTFAAGMLGMPTLVQARHEGFVSLGGVARIVGPLQGSSTYVRRQWARDHADLLERYLAANIEAQRWLMSPANKAKVIELIATEVGGSRAAAQEAYEKEMGPGGWQADMRFDLEAFRNVLALRAEIEGTWNGTPPAPDKYYDGSYYQRALATIGSR